MEWLFDRTKETVSITAVSPLRVAAATVEPKLNQVLVRLGLTRDQAVAVWRWDQFISRRISRMQDNIPSRA